jgi:hypothetical protein
VSFSRGLPRNSSVGQDLAVTVFQTGNAVQYRSRFFLSDSAKIIREWIAQLRPEAAQVVQNSLTVDT